MAKFESEDATLGAGNVVYFTAVGDASKQQSGVLRMVSGRKGSAVNLPFIGTRETGAYRTSLELKYKDNLEFYGRLRSIDNPVELTRLFTSPELTRKQRLATTLDLLALASSQAPPGFGKANQSQLP